jgi:NAD(P)H-hydrate epimerase
MSSAANDAPVSFISADQARAIDEKLMSPTYGFSIDQLMELAGLSVASATCEVYPPRSHRRVLVLAGPGNNGGDGLVAARHLHHFGYEVEVCYPKRTDKSIYTGLVIQLETLGVRFVDIETLRLEPLVVSHAVVLDAMFGFSFRGAPRAPFDELLEMLDHHNSPPAIVAVDIPSGWDVDEGDIKGTGMRPEVLVSLTAPKLGAKTFTGAHHFVGGRFVPPGIASEFGIELPPYVGSSQCARVSGLGSAGVDNQQTMKPMIGAGALAGRSGQNGTPPRAPLAAWSSSDEDSDEE